jgi:hypothetical protein
VCPALFVTLASHDNLCLISSPSIVSPFLLVFARFLLIFAHFFFARSFHAMFFFRSLLSCNRFFRTNERATRTSPQVTDDMQSGSINLRQNAAVDKPESAVTIELEEDVELTFALRCVEWGLCFHCIDVRTIALMCAPLHARGGAGGSGAGFSDWRCVLDLYIYSSAHHTFDNYKKYANPLTHTHTHTGTSTSLPRRRRFPAP